MVYVALVDARHSLQVRFAGSHEGGETGRGAVERESQLIEQLFQSDKFDPNLGFLQDGEHLAGTNDVAERLVRARGKHKLADLLASFKNYIGRALER